MKKHLIVIAGPTASGKSSLGMYLAAQLKTEILSADSRQFYKEMTIGTAKPHASDLSAIKHHFINTLSIEEEYSSGDFERDGLALLDEIFQEKQLAILVGGSGLYIQALCEGLDEFPDIDPKIRKDLNELFEKEGIEVLQKMLAKKDSKTFEEIDKHNSRRLIRALEVIIGTSRPYSDFRRQTHKTRPFEIIKIGLKLERSALYEQINKRVDMMLHRGLVEEAKALYPKRANHALQTLGYQELFDYFDNQHSLEKAVELIKRNSRRFAKRQMTWFKRDSTINWFHPSQRREILAFLRQKMTDG